MNFDDNALYRHPDIRELRDLGEEDPLEIEASKFSLNYIHLDGNIGCMVNGAGLAMATMDIIKLAGGEPANFLDVGGGANAEQIRNAFKILMSDKNVKAVLINIFGGILRCDVLAQGVIAAVKELGVPVPIVIRMEGTNVEEGQAAAARERPELRDGRLDGRGGRRRSCSWPGDASRTRSRSHAVRECASVIDSSQSHMMAVLIDKNTRLIVQGLTGREGTFHAKQAAAYGTTVVGGVTPGKGGTTHEGWPVFDTVHDAVREDRRERVGHLRAAAVRGRRDHGSGRRRHRAGRLHHRGHPDARHDARDDVPARRSPTTRLIGPNCPGRHLAGQGARPASFPGNICTEGRIGIVSKSGTLTYEAIHQLTRLGMGQTHLHRHRRRSADRHVATSTR